MQIAIPTFAGGPSSNLGRPLSSTGKLADFCGFGLGFRVFALKCFLNAFRQFLPRRSATCCRVATAPFRPFWGVDDRTSKNGPRTDPMTHNKPPSPSIPKTIAVALEEQPDQGAPRITASGRGFVAEQILQIAFANGVKVREDADLVQILAAVDVDSEIPTEAFAAVSEILAYVYRANGQVPPTNLNTGSMR